MQDVEYIDLIDQNGNEERVRVVTFFKVEQTGKEYVVVVPADIEEETDEAYVLRCTVEEDGSESYETIDDEEEFNMVSEAYELLAEELDEE